MTTEVERRFTPGKVETLRRGDTADAARTTIGGYAAKFNRPSQNLGGFVEEIRAGAFNKSRGDGWPDVMARYNHDDNLLLGTTAAGTLRLSVDDTGLMYEVDPPGSRADVVELVTRGDVTKSSFAFRTLEDEWGLTDQGFPLRTLISAALVDVAPVNTPAYIDTTTGLRSLAERMDAPLEEIRSMAEHGELRKLFIRTDGGAAVKQTFGAAAIMELLGRKSDPWT